MTIGRIDTSYDFTMDAPGYWDGFWGRKGGLGAGGSDPDVSSPTLKRYHQMLWSRRLPNGEVLKLEPDPDGYLRSRDMRFGSDSITASFRYRDCREMLGAVARLLPDYRSLVENFLHRAYTVGGMIIFPRHPGSINQCRGTNRVIRDRWDLTLECIRRFYRGEPSPLSEALGRDRSFFDLFVDFKGYVDFFFLQDCVTDDYEKVRFWLGKGDFCESPLPRMAKEYLSFIEAELDFVERRNASIRAWDSVRLEEVSFL